MVLKLDPQPIYIRFYSRTSLLLFYSTPNMDSESRAFLYAKYKRRHGVNQTMYDHRHITLK